MDGSQYFEEGIAIIRFLNFYLAIKQRWIPFCTIWGDEKFSRKSVEENSRKERVRKVEPQILYLNSPPVSGGPLYHLV